MRWERVNEYLKEFGFPTSGENGFIPENIFYKLCFKASNETARAFQDKVTDEILPDIRRYGMYATENTIDRILDDPDFGIALLTKYKEEKRQRALAELQRDKLQEQLDEAHNWFTIKRVAQINNISWRILDWRRLKHQSIVLNKQIQKIFDANFGEVNLYHIDVFRTVYPGLRYE